MLVRGPAAGRSHARQRCRGLLVPGLTRGIDRRVVLLGFSLLMIASNLLVAFSSSLLVLLLMRILLGIALGGFWSMAAAVAMRLVPAALLALAIGVTAFVLQRSTEPAIHPHDEQQPGSAIASVAVRWLILLMVALGTIVGVVDVVSVAFAQQQGQPAAASIVLSVYAIGSCLAGLAFGALKLDVPLPRLFLYGGVATALTTLPLLLASDIFSLALTVFVAGLFFAPTLIVAMALIERIVPPAKLTEGLTWLVTGLSIGVAIGAAGSGWLVDAFGARSGFWLAIVGGLVVLLAALQSFRRLR